MTTVGNKKLHPLVPYVYEMAISFFEAARQSLDPVLQAIDGYQQLETLENGRPAPPDQVTRKFGELSSGECFRHLGSCISATTNLGLAYAHTFRLLILVLKGEEALPTERAKPILTKLYDTLPAALRDELSEIHTKVGAHDFEIQMSLGPFPIEVEKENDRVGGRDFRSQLVYWQRHHLLQDSHLSLFGDSRASVMRFFIPLRSVLMLDRILATKVAPMLRRPYRTMDEQMSSRTDDPELKWDGEEVLVALPDKLGRTLEARWKPTITSVIRIRDSGTESWGPGFETPFNMCSFVDLEPDTEYDVQVTHKNDAGESEPSITTMKTEPKAS